MYVGWGVTYEQYLNKIENMVVQDTSSSAQNDAMMMYVIEEMSNQVAKCNEQFDLNDKEKYIDGQLQKVIVDKNTKVADFKNQIHSLKQQLNATVESHKTLSTTVDVLKIESKAKEDKYLDEIIELEKQKKALDNVIYKIALGYQNPLYLSQAQRKVPTLYCGNTIVKLHAALFDIDTEETLKLAEEKRKTFKIKEKELLLENDRLLELLISQDLVHTVVNSLAEILDYESLEKCFLDEYSECVELKAELSKRNDMVEKLKAKDNSISKLKDHIATLKGKNVSEGNKSENISKVLAPVIQIVLWYMDLRCSKHMTGNRSQLINFVSKFMGTIRFGNDHVAAIKGCGHYHIGNIMISQVYYVEGLGHNLLLVGQFCDSDLEVAFRKHTCFVHDLEGVDLLKGSRGSNLYTLSLEEMMQSSPICLVRGLPKLKHQKDHLCSACSLGKSKKHTHKPKSDDSIQEKLYLLHMDLYGPMRIESINGKKNILVIVDDY
ncbi:hypothetical protein Tco_0287391 [Tanacetum coccineum]